MIQKKRNNPTMLIILDGFGYREEKEGNAIKTANMPNWQKWLTIYPNTLLKASGKAVGLLPGYMGNSEVGHTTIGSGRIVKTTLVRFHETIDDGSFFNNQVLIENFKKLKKDDNTLHLMGLLSDAGVHSHEKHLHALIKLANQVGLKKVFVHPFLDGRDTPPKSAATYLKKLDDLNAKIASLHGRFYAMDRDNNWNRTAQTYDVLTKQKNNVNLEWRQVLDESYQNKITDEFVKPTLLLSDGIIKKDDGIIFFNFRADRARQLTQSFIDPNFNEFRTTNLNSTRGSLSFFITTTRYKESFSKFNNAILFEKEKIEHTLLDEIAQQTSKKVFVIAETEKYAHVTYFFRGMTEKQLPNETYKLIPSIKVKGYENNPEMSAPQITKEILESLQTNVAYFYLVNYANADMVGHSGNFDATVKACECIDEQVGKLYQEVVEKQNGTLFITADHGNAEEMIDEKSGQVKTAHTNNPVVFMMVNKQHAAQQSSKLEKPTFGQAQLGQAQLGQANIAPTILKHLGLSVPKEMVEERAL